MGLEVRVRAKVRVRVRVRVRGRVRTRVRARAARLLCVAAVLSKGVGLVHGLGGEVLRDELR